MPSHLLDRCALARVQSWDHHQRIPPQAELAIDVRWPTSTGQVQTGRATVLCIGPADWLVLSSGPDGAELSSTLADALKESACRVTDLSSALARIGVAGPQARTLLSSGCGLDFGPRGLRAGQCARTRFAGMPVVIHCKETDVFECIVALSFHQYLVAWLAAAGYH
jgi:sarcosine oxidase subunit gamma